MGKKSGNSGRATLHYTGFNKQLSTQELAKKTGIELTKARRLVKHFLPLDPEAGLQSGKKRTHRLNDAFKIFLAYFFVTKYGFTENDADAIFKDIWQWLDSELFLPEYAEIKIDGEEVVSDWEPEEGHTEDIWGLIIYETIVSIIRANTNSGFFYIAKKIISKESKTRKGKTIITTKHTEQTIIPKPEPFLCDDTIVYTLPISKLLKDFRQKTLDSLHPF